jgi:hypothetical protein
MTERAFVAGYFSLTKTAGAGQRPGPEALAKSPEKMLSSGHE